MKKHTSTNHGSAASRSIVLAFWFGVVGLLSLGVACYGDVKIVEDPAVVPPTGDPEVGVGGLEGPDCIVDEVGCDGALLRVCKAAVLNAQALPHWEPIQNCFSAALCDPAGSCREAKCAANAMRCDGAVPWTCSDDLTERVEQGACVNAGHCSLVESDCAAEDKQAPCCLDAPCTAGALRCNGGQIERCRDDRTGSDPVMGANCATQALCEDSLATCQPGSSCVCKPPECDVGAGRCTGATLERCNADQTGWEFAEDCGSEGLCKIGQERHAASVIWLQRLARAAVDPSVAAEHAKDWMKVEALLTSLIALSRPDLPTDWHQERAGALLALLDGLAAAALTEPERMPAERARRLLGVELDRLSVESEPN